MSVAQAAALRAEGNALYAAASHAAASELYASAAATAQGVIERGGEAERAAASRELVLALNNRAACHISLKQPQRALADTSDALRACLTHGEGRAWRQRLPDGPGWSDWVRDAYAKVMLRRATAFAAAGSPLAGLPPLTWVQSCARGTSMAAQAAKAASKLLLLESDDCMEVDDVARAATRVGRWSRMAVDLREAAPEARVHAGVAALDGFLHVFGGTLCDEKGTPAGDFWRLPLSRGDGSELVRWERLTAPDKAGWPPKAPGSQQVRAHARPGGGDIDAQRLALLIIVTAEEVWSYTPAEGVWLRCATLWQPDHGNVDDVLPTSALMANGETLLVLRWIEEMYSSAMQLLLHTVCLSQPSSASTVRSYNKWPCGAPPLMEFALAWYDGERLRVWGGADKSRRENRCINASSADWAGIATDAGFGLLVSLDEMWELPLSCDDTDAGASHGPWRRSQHDGGGGPPAGRMMFAGVALPASAPAQAIVIGGISHNVPFVYKGKTFPFRCLCDVHVWARGEGWRRVRLPAAGSPGAAAHPPGGSTSASLAFDHSTGRAFFAAGDGSGASNARSLACHVYELHIDGICGDATSAVEAAERAALDKAVHSLRRGPFLYNPPDSTGTMQPPSRESFETMLRRAAAARRDDRDIWLISWSCFAGGPACDDDNTDVYMLSVARQSDTSRPPFFTGVCTGPPSASDCAWALLSGMATEPGFRPGKVRFSARTAGVLQVLLPLLDAVGVAADLETWAEAAECALAYESDPWGAPDNGHGARCVRCGAKTKLRRCAGCKRARYCSAECATADWPVHKPACAVLKRGSLGRWRSDEGGQSTWEPSEAAKAAAGQSNND